MTDIDAERVRLLRRTGYAPIRRLGDGGYGSVWLARDRNGKDVAIKFLDKADADAVRRFQREVKILAGVQSPHIAKIYAYDLREHPHYVMEYCEPGALRDWTNNNHAWPDVAAVLLHALRGLEVLHQSNGFHRDIKPDNLLLNRSPDGRLTVKLGDFGLARVPHIDESTMTHKAGGTRGYMAPETIAGEPFTGSADIYSLGITGIELLTGAKAVDSLGNAEAPDQLKRLIHAMCRSAASERPTASQARVVLEQLLQPYMQPKKPEKPKLEPQEPSLLPWLIGGALLLGAGMLLSEEVDEYDD